MAGSLALSESMLPGLREQFPGIHFTYCLDDDIIGARPVLQHERFNLYLVDTSSHCFTFTADAALATGIVVAEIDD